jgi:phage terminase large subunit-like protein
VSRLAFELATTLALDEQTSRAKKVKLRRYLLEKKRRMALSSLFYFAKYVLGFSDMEVEPHWELCRFLEKYCYDDKLILLPRGTFKSSVISVAYPLWLFLKDRNLRCLLSSGELTNTKNFLGLISQNLQYNDEFKKLFGDWTVGSDTWHQTAVSFSGRTRMRAEDSITASSLKVTKVSQHYDFGVFDDLQTDKNISSREMVDEIESYLQKMLPILDPQVNWGSHTGKPGARTIVGTRWGFDDIYGRMIARENDRRRRGLPPTLRMMVKKAYDRAGKLYFPARFTKEFLDQLKTEGGMSEYIFSCQYLNDPMPEASQIFKLKNLGFFNTTHRVMDGVVTPMPILLNNFTTLDPSITDNDQSDWCAFVTNSVDTEWNLYCWEVVRERVVGNEAMIDRMFDIHERLSPYRFGVEAVQFQISILHGFESACRRMGKWFPVEALKTGNIRKDLRIRGFEPFVSGKKFYLRVRDGIDLTAPAEDLYFSLLPGQDILADEMLKFPLGGTDDCIDAQSYMPQLVFPATPAVSKERAPVGSLEWVRKQMKRRSGGGGLLSVR